MRHSIDVSGRCKNDMPMFVEKPFCISRMSHCVQDLKTFLTRKAVTGTQKTSSALFAFLYLQRQCLGLLTRFGGSEKLRQFKLQDDLSEGDRVNKRDETELAMQQVSHSMGPCLNVWYLLFVSLSRDSR